VRAGLLFEELERPVRGPGRPEGTAGTQRVIDVTHLDQPADLVGLPAVRELRVPFAVEAEVVLVGDRGRKLHARSRRQQDPGSLDRVSLDDLPLRLGQFPLLVQNLEGNVGLAHVVQERSFADRPNIGRAVVQVLGEGHRDARYVDRVCGRVLVYGLQLDQGHDDVPLGVHRNRQQLDHGRRLARGNHSVLRYLAVQPGDGLSFRIQTELERRDRSLAADTGLGDVKLAESYSGLSMQLAGGSTPFSQIQAGDHFLHETFQVFAGRAGGDVESLDPSLLQLEGPLPVPEFRQKFALVLYFALSERKRRERVLTEEVREGRHEV
jgi:hypothetical protein